MLRKDLIVLNLEGTTSSEILREFGQKFVEVGVAKDTFCDALVAREEKYPTGLPAKAFDIAVPHTFKEHINEPAMGVGIVKNHVMFHQMGSPEIDLYPRVLFMLAVKDPTQQIETLKKIMKLIQSEDKLEKILNSKSEDEIFDLLEGF
ncbi:MAG: PTS sugar transporter subunit IIA [Firmicutes bacterium]|nr:PTS sugar transporter subunit IIA [Bacillota bacterium]